MEDCPSWLIDDSGEQRCVSECPEGSRVWEGTQCETCAMRDRLAPYLDGDACVPLCPFERPRHENGVCKTCEGDTVWDGLACTECPDSAPVFEGGACRQCEVKDGGLFWNGKSCVDEC